MNVTDQGEGVNKSAAETSHPPDDSQAAGASGPANRVASPANGAGRSQEPIDKQTLPELVADLLQMVVTFVREQVGYVIEESAAGPLRRAGKVAATGILAALLFGTAAVFIAVSLFLLLLVFIPAWAAVGLVGLVLTIAGVVVIAAGKRR